MEDPVRRASFLYDLGGSSTRHLDIQAGVTNPGMDHTVFAMGYYMGLLPPQAEIQMSTSVAGLPTDSGHSDEVSAVLYLYTVEKVFIW